MQSWWECKWLIVVVAVVAAVGGSALLISRGRIEWMLLPHKKCAFASYYMKVIRIYDNRFRKTHRTPVVYLECGDIIGPSSEIFSLHPEKEESIVDFNPSSEIHGDRSLIIISTPYHKGGHVVSKPTDFVPIIRQLHELHKKGFVHGDIRAFNTVIGEGGTSSWLIDFDFGGMDGTAKYPPGYRRNLDDGTRIGREGNLILKSEDWFALGQLIFSLYELIPPDPASASSEPSSLAERAERVKWTRLESLTNVEDKDVNTLIEFLETIERRGWNIVPSSRLKQVMDEEEAGTRTNPRATGSPPKKQHD